MASSAHWFHRMLERCCDASLAEEPRAELLVPREVLGEHLQRDEAVELLVMPGVDDGHAAASKLALDRVRAQSRSPSPCFLP